MATQAAPAIRVIDRAADLADANQLVRGPELVEAAPGQVPVRTEDGWEPRTTVVATNTPGGPGWYLSSNANGTATWYAPGPPDNTYDGGTP